MAAFDNVSLASPPNIATAGNYAQMLMQGLSAIPQDYQRGQQFQYQQRQNNLFQNGLPTDQAGNIDYNAMLKQMLQSGGAPVASSLIPQLLGQQANQQAAKAFGDQPQVNTGPTSSTAAASPASIGGQQPQPSADSGQSVRTLSAGIGGADRDIPGPAMDYIARGLGLSDANATIPPGLEQKARDNISAYLSRAAGAGRQPMGSAATGGITPNRGGTNPVPQSGLQDEGNANQQTPVGSSGGVGPISPAPTSASGAIAGTPARQPFAERFDASYGPPTTKDIELHETRGTNLLKAASTIFGLSPEARTGYRDAGNKELEIAKQMREERAKYFEPTSEQKNVATGTERAKGQIAADTKYYDSLHRGLAGSGMISAQQKQNIDILRQVAASPSFTPGAGSGLALAFQRLAAQFGINPAGAAPREIFNQVAARILADQFSGIKSLASETGEQGGRIFKPMLDIEEKANITSEDSLEGIKAKLDLLDKTGDLMMRWADKADDYKLKHGQLDGGFDKELRSDIAKARVSNAVPSKTSPGAPPVGHVEGGYRFKGGDHRKAENWEPAR